MNWRIAGLLLLVLVACEGPVGPQGPAGPVGPQGEPGPGTRITFAGQVDASGAAFAILPAEAGTMTAPPVVTCYLSDNSAGPFLIVATDTFSGVICGVRQGVSTLEVVIVGAPAFWFVRFAVVY